MDRPNCSDCQHGRESYTGNGVNEPREYDFNCIKIDEGKQDVIDFWDKYDKDIDVIMQNGPAECSLFIPWMVDDCFWKGCKAEMHIPLYQTKYFSTETNSGEPVFFCSDDCKDAYLVAETMDEADHADSYR